MVGNLSIKGRIVSISVFAGQMVSVVPPQSCHCRVKVAIDNMETNGGGCVPVKLDL